MLAYIDYPSWLTPEVFGFLNLPANNFLNIIRWYALAYILGIIISYFQSQYILKHDNLETLNKPVIDDYYFWAIIGLVLGGRIFSCLVYNFNLYITHPFEIILPFSDIKFVDAYGMIFHIFVLIIGILLFILLKKEKITIKIFWRIIGIIYLLRILYCFLIRYQYYSKHIMEIILPFSGKFTGFAGMAYHGAVIGVFLASIIFAYRKKINFRELCDLVFPIIPLGYTLGRIANFINGELWGRITSFSFGVLFPNADRVPLNLAETQDVISKLGWKIEESSKIVLNHNGKELYNLIGNIPDTSILGINLPRHPSQLYEAFFEGIILFLIMWFFARKYKPFKGFSASIYLIFYSIFRFFLEFFRQPDSQFANIDAGKYIGSIIGFLSMGQILSIIMFLLGIGIGIFYYYLSKKDNEDLTKIKKQDKG